MQLPPASVILSWPRPNYENPSEVRGPLVIILNSIFASLMLFVIFIRIFSRIHVSKSFGWDDVFIIAAVIPTLGCGTITILGSIKYGWSRHVYDVPFAHLVIGLKLTMLIECLFATSCSFTKLSLLCFTHKITKGLNSRVMRTLIIVNASIVTLELIVFCIVAVFTCRPVSAYWTLSTKPQECINETAHLLGGGILNTLTDVSVVFLPFPTVMSLKLPTRQRVMLCVLFGAGFVIAASLASLKPFIVRYCPALLGSLASKKTGPTSFSFLNSFVLRISAPRPAEENKNHSKPKVFDSQTETITSTIDCDIEFEALNPHNAGAEATRSIGQHDSGHVSKSTLHSADATLQWESKKE
ncbi:hypothetical protein TESG_02939 [Trichophyton tonsurans CBS 112818]|uniref:Rhodopsin domain-containing protein n=1 Tax=Trichophyton tonsurans (strain CBS 112818) TaxID=647933 RepID=F2RVV9_TRIT1|nr:hypothetical protein TESG_02939 [Trichophyton tonsurans CBS 112818]